MSYVGHHFLQLLLQVGVSLPLQTTPLGKLEVVPHQGFVLSLLLPSDAI